MPIATILGHKFIELISGYEVNDLGEYILANIHNLAVFACKITLSFSNQKIKDRFETLINKGIYRD